MMSKISAIVLLPVAFSLALATVLPTRDAAETCWSGEIHYPCDGATTGCTPGGIMVACQSSSNAMIFNSSCGPGTGQGTCAYDADCNAYCA
ncbi:uncharacterized protein F4822DRAFT_428061 [Hypoxylon trugodes]|uniref:uncharacterized protein n=1 Tax=Hypoxylon trugodes TaxID=326681 RepID=UPI00219C2CCB|nr:uncharacterized protein F4822DRAFT_428061 [Hypoxylon trugodes]KAI1389718.1 hypothetical protein F4822DRAFT_428061 [Hypoxylon trugodes]